MFITRVDRGRLRSGPRIWGFESSNAEFLISISRSRDDGSSSLTSLGCDGRSCGCSSRRYFIGLIPTSDVKFGAAAVTGGVWRTQVGTVRPVQWSFTAVTIMTLIRAATVAVFSVGPHTMNVIGIISSVILVSITLIATILVVGAAATEALWGAAAVEGSQTKIRIVGKEDVGVRSWFSPHRDRTGHSTITCRSYSVVCSYNSHHTACYTATYFSSRAARTSFYYRCWVCRNLTTGVTAAQIKGVCKYTIEEPSSITKLFSNITVKIISNRRW